VRTTYGSDSDNISPPGGLGFDGSGTAAPFTASIKFHSSALYYVINAQLQGGGDITCSVSVKVTVHFSDGTHHSKSKVIAHGHASGGVQHLRRAGRELARPAERPLAGGPADPVQAPG
jgi:hypothetical protein